MNTATLKDVIGNRKLISIEQHATVQQAAEIMAAANKGAVLVIGDGRLQGIFTERDLLTRVVASRLDPTKLQIAQVMSSRLVVGSPNESTYSGLQKMLTANCRHLPVVDQGRVVGIVSRRELMALDLKKAEEELQRADPATLFI